MRRISLKKPVQDRLSERFARELNESQLAAATAPDGYNLILAGPGSGKTRVITYRVAYLIAKGVAPESILLVTFTRRAAREMMVRLEELIGGQQASSVWAGTFHHIGNRILRRSAQALGFGPNFTILDSEDQLDFVRLAMDETGLFGTGKMSPKPATVQQLLSHSFNLASPLNELVTERYPDLLAWLPQLEKTAEVYATKKREANSMDYDDLLKQWARLVDEFPDQKAAQGRMFRHILIDEMQDTNLVQIRLIESLAQAGSGNLTAVGDDAQSIYRFRGANYDNILKFPDRHPQARMFRLEVNYRSTPEIVAFTNASIAHNTSGFAKHLVSARPAGLRPVVIPAADAYEESEFLCQQILEFHEEGIALNRMAVLYRNHHDSILLQADLVARGIPYSVRSGMRFFEQAHVKDVLAYLRIVVNPQDETAWRRLFLLLPGIGPAKASAIYQHLGRSPKPLEALMSAETMKLIPSKSKGFFAGFVADLMRIHAAEPHSQPALAIAAIAQSGYPATLRAKYDRAENRLADIDQLAVLAAKYDSLERLIGDLLLAGDVYSVDNLSDAGNAEDLLVLSTIHQAKGLEWSRVFVPRLIEDSFPSYRSLDELGGEEEERRIFYVAVTRAMDELFLTYPLMIARGGRGPSMLTTPSRFLTEVDPTLFEPAILETETDLDTLRTWPQPNSDDNQPPF